MRIITCCSRSGSSFVCQLLHELGANFGEPDKLVKPDEWNKKGYFENRAINKINHELLFGSWSKPELWIDVMWPKDPLIRIRKLSTLALAPLASRKKSILKRGSKRKEEIKKLAEELKGQVVKDPRFCYIMQPWAQTEEIESVLFVLRNPWESCRSMSKQTGLPLGLTFLGWKDSIVNFFETEMNFPVKIVNYNSFFEEENKIESMKVLFEFLNIDFDEELATSTLAKSIDPNMRNYSGVDKKIPDSINKLYQSILDGSIT